MEETNSNKKSLTKKKRVKWDEIALEEHEREKLENPKMKINEPKTPYNPIDDDEDDPYFQKLKEIRNIKPSVNL